MINIIKLFIFNIKNRYQELTDERSLIGDYIHIAIEKLYLLKFPKSQSLC